MPRRFPTPPPETPADPAAEPVLAPDEITHRYSGKAASAIRAAIAAARAASGETVAPAPVPVHSWAPERPPMSAAETGDATEVTQRYADRSVAGIRAQIAAAREAQAHGSPTRAPGRFAQGDASAPKVPSMLIEPRAEKPVADDDEAKP